MLVFIFVFILLATIACAWVITTLSAAADDLLPSPRISPPRSFTAYEYQNHDHCGLPSLASNRQQRLHVQRMQLHMPGRGLWNTTTARLLKNRCNNLYCICTSSSSSYNADTVVVAQLGHDVPKSYKTPKFQLPELIVLLTYYECEVCNS